MNKPTSSNEVNLLTKEREKLREFLSKFIKKVENHSECGQKQLSLLCLVTKPIQTVRKLFLLNVINFWSFSRNIIIPTYLRLKIKSSN